MRTEKCSKHPRAALGRRSQERLQVGQSWLDLWAQLLEFPPFLREFFMDNAALGTGSCPQVDALQLEPSSQNARLGADGTPPPAGSKAPSSPWWDVLGRGGIAQPFPGPSRQWLIPAPPAFLLEHHNTGVLLQQQIGPLSLRNNDCCW